MRLPYLAPHNAPTWRSGQMSPLARRHFERRGWFVFESYTIAAER